MANIVRVRQRGEFIEDADKMRGYVDVLMENILGVSNGMALDDSVPLVGHSFIDHMVDLCEALLGILCWDYAADDGRYHFPTLKDLFPESPEGPVLFPAEVSIAAGALISIKKNSGKKSPKPEVIERLLTAVREFIVGISSMAKESMEVLQEYAEWIGKLEQAYNEKYEAYLKDHNFLPDRQKPRTAYNLILPENKNIDILPDEELDEYYKRKNKKSDKHLAMLEILELMKKYATDRDHRLGVQEVTRLLEEKSGIKMERKAVGYALLQMQEADFLCKVIGENGYWFDENLYKDRNAEYNF